MRDLKIVWSYRHLGQRVNERVEDSVELQTSRAESK
jgi:hypothetical protein